MTEYNETIESPSERDAQEIAALYGEEATEAPVYHSVLEAWQAVLGPAAEEATKNPSPQWCSKIVGSYYGVDFRDCLNVRDHFYEKIATLKALLDRTIEENPDCLKVQTHAEDLVENGKLYLDLIFNWQAQYIAWEVEWDCQSGDAAAELAGMGEVHKMFFGEMGILPYLNSINFEMTEADQADLAEFLNSIPESMTAGGERE